jgi:hypothetical protein
VTPTPQKAASRAAVVLAGLLAGCAPRGPALYDVSGTVTYDGKPLPAGQVYFEPDAAKGTDGTQGVANVKGGKYDTAAGGRGVRGGPVIVRVRGFDGVESDEFPRGRLLFDNHSEPWDVPGANATRDIAVKKAAR